MTQSRFDEFRQQLHPDLATLSIEQIKVVADVVHEQIEKRAQTVMDVLRKEMVVQVRNSKEGCSYHGCMVSLDTKSATLTVEIGHAEQDRSVSLLRLAEELRVMQESRPVKRRRAA